MTSAVNAGGGVQVFEHPAASVYTPGAEPQLEGGEEPVWLPVL